MMYSLTDAEQTIMDILWKKKQWLSISDLSDELNGLGVFWKRQTINTFLARMIKKELVIHNSERRKYIFAYTKEEYESLRAKEFLDVEYSGSLKKFIAALTGQKEISQNDIPALFEYLEKYK